MLDAPCLGDFHDTVDWEMFDFTVSSAESPGPSLASSCGTSLASLPPFDEESPQRGFTEYHLLIYSMP